MQTNQSSRQKKEEKIVLTKKIIRSGLIYVLNEEEKTACVFGNYSAVDDIIIPPSIEHNSQEYIVISILENSFNNDKQIKSISFPKDSKIKKIEKNSFTNSSIQKISIPSSLIELEEGWCSSTYYLKKIEISPDNNNFILYNDKFILGKSDPNIDIYDVLTFASRDIETAEIPSYVKKIDAYAFEIKKLKQVDILNDSKLEVIGKYAFHASLIEKINIPIHLKQICEGAFTFCKQYKKFEIPQNSEIHIIEKKAFYNSGIETVMIPPHLTKIHKWTFALCMHLNRIEIPINSELQTIGKYAFFASSINNFYFPSNLKNLKENWCWATFNLNEFSVSPNNQMFKLYDNKFVLKKSNVSNKNFDVLVLAKRDIEKANLPDFIKQIGQLAFNECKKLKSVEIPENSKLQIIENKAFCQSSIENISLPSNLVELKNGWCYDPTNLNEIKINQNNHNFKSYQNDFILGKSSPKSDIFDVLVFARRDIKTAIIPSFIKQIGPYAFNNCQNLQHVKIPEKSELQIIGQGAFNYSSIESISIPSHVSQICEDAFSMCFKLRNVEIPFDSELKIIENGSFYQTLINDIFIPKSVTIIKKDAFSGCKKLTRVKIQDNSQLQTIENNAFSHSSLKSINLPNQISKIDDEAFMFCEYLKKIGISKNSKIKTIGKKAFASCSIESIIVPSYVVYFDSKIFEKCKHLLIIEIPENSELKCIDIGMLIGFEQILFMIPFELNGILA